MYSLPPVFMPAQPDAVILDIEQFVRLFRWSIKPKHNCPKFVSEIVHSIICCFRDAHVAEYELMEFVAQVEMHEHWDSESAVMIRPDYAKPILDLGLAILKHMHELKIFNLDGKLNYEYYSYEIPDFPGTVLKRIEEL